MKIDDTLATVDRLWGEISILVVTHAVAIGALLYADVVPSEVVTANVAPVASLAAISGFRARVQSIGLDLPIVVATAAIVYIVVFQRLSAALLHLPVLKLEYDEPALWRAGKCFAELRQLAVWFSGYTASGKLSDLATTLDLAITGLADTYHEYHDRMVVQPQALANAWSRYYAGFCLLGFVALLGGLLSGSSSHPWMPPFVLFCSALFTRCGWEVQIERSVLSRLRYAINCGIVNGLKRREQPDEDRGQSTSVSGRELHQPLAALQAGLGITPLSELATTTPGDAAQLARDLEIAAELVELPPPGLPYGVWWGLHALRRLRPLHDIGYLPLIHNEVFRGWLFETDPDIRGLAESIDSRHHHVIEVAELSCPVAMKAYLAGTLPPLDVDPVEPSRECGLQGRLAADALPITMNDNDVVGHQREQRLNVSAYDCSRPSRSNVRDLTPIDFHAICHWRTR